MKKIEISNLPTLKTKVAIFGSVKHQEVGGTYCASYVIALVSG
jgi:hypothetical protein